MKKVNVSAISNEVSLNYVPDINYSSDLEEIWLLAGLAPMSTLIERLLEK